jgi:hypothetical protein
LKRVTERKIDEASIYEHTLLNDIAQMIVNTSKMQIFRRCNNSSAKTLESFYNILRNHNLTKAIHSCGVGTSYNNHNHIIISITSRNAKTITNLKEALLYQEHKFLSHQALPSPKYEQKYRIDLPELKKKERGYFSGRITKFVDQPLKVRVHENEFALKISAPEVHDYSLPETSTLTWDTATACCNTGITTSSACIPGREIGWVGVKRENEKGKGKEPDLEMFKEEKLAKEYDHTNLEFKEVSTPLKINNGGLINKTELVESRSNLRITKEEKMKIEYGVHLVSGRAQITKTRIDKII